MNSPLTPFPTLSPSSMKPRRHCWLPLAWSGCMASALAGAPQLDETCRDRDMRPVPIIYTASGTRFFAEASVVPAAERQAARERGLPPVAIRVNPELYFLGQRTQQWLYLRQCVHIQQDHPIARLGERALTPLDEEQADCMAFQQMVNSPVKGSSSTAPMSMVQASIESDMDRVLRENRWNKVLPGPQRRISFDRCGK